MRKENRLDPRTSKTLKRKANEQFDRRKQTANVTASLKPSSSSAYRYFDTVRSPRQDQVNTQTRPQMNYYRRSTEGSNQF